MRIKSYMILALISLFIFIPPTSASTSISSNPSQPSIMSFDVEGKYRAWQGVAVDENYIYVLGSGDNNGVINPLENIISVYTKDGNLVKEVRDAYTGLDSEGYKMSFGDGTVIDGDLFIVVYNAHARHQNPETWVSKIIRYDLPSLKIISEHDIGKGLAESVTKKLDDYFVTYHDAGVLKRFSEDFVLKKEHVLSQPIEAEGGYQGSFWIGDTIYLNMHGSNEYGKDYAYGLDRYTFDGEKFTFVDRTKPPTYGSGQGVEYQGGYYYWADRVDNRIVITNSLKSGNLNVFSPPSEQSFYKPELLNGWQVYNGREIIVWKDPFGVVHIEGMIANGHVGDGQNTLPAFILPDEYLPIDPKNYSIVANSTFGRLNITSTGHVNVTHGDNTWVSLDGTSYMTMSR